MRPETIDFYELKLSLPARSENLARVRRSVSDFAASVGVCDDVIADMRLAVNEACSNIVRHAYEQEGEMEVEARPVGEHLVVVVHDSGRGLAQPTTNPGAGLGLRVATALSEWIEVRGRGKGTEVRLAFPLGQAAY